MDMQELKQKLATERPDDVFAWLFGQTKDEQEVLDNYHQLGAAGELDYYTNAQVESTFMTTTGAVTYTYSPARLV
ncbi:MAG: hypothetical protein AMXMBFR31_23370 [Candidatus Desulfobacillus denitrificans]|jgi:hypothetical protein|nr:hypothetical protein [Anaerolineae bacterium]